MLFKGEGIRVVSIIHVCAFSNRLLLARPNVWCWGDVHELDLTIAHKDLTVREVGWWQTLAEQEDWFHDRALSGAMETALSVSDPCQDFSEEAIFELVVTSRGRQRGASFREREH